MARWLRFVVSLGVLSVLVGLALPPQEAVAKTPSGDGASACAKTGKSGG
jgi:hypothetical protein